MATTVPGANDGNHRRRGWIEDARCTLSAPVAAELSQARRRAGLTLRAAAKRSGVAHGHISALEHGKRAPSIAVAEALVDALKLRADVAARLLAESVPDAGRSWRPAAPDEQADAAA